MAVKIFRDFRCPYCGGTEYVRGWKGGVYGQVVNLKHLLSTQQTIQFQICKRCGTIIREFIANPEELPDY